MCDAVAMWLGACALWFRDKYILLLITLIAAVAIAVATFAKAPENVFMSTWAPRVTVIAAILAAVSAAIDKFADRHAKKLEARSTEAERKAGARAVIRLMAFLDYMEKVSRSTPGAARQQMPAVRLAAAELASQIPSAPDVRASFYPLTKDASGNYQMTEPVSRGRPEDATTEFRAADHPTHSIWRELTTPAKNCEIRDARTPVPDLDWGSKPYKTFVTVPVRVGNAVFGMLTANALKVGDLTELDRVSLIVAARMLALAEAAAAGDELKTRNDVTTLKSLGPGTIEGAS
ncbi:hypothetical protein MGAD_52080 [Mycolicibacterium gadium]|uniref:GAF domain-containing protein n=2 Tax=Mycolicibacterium gadium TaxID=1794 RepID=A0A7I7WWJ1_MYCGU|nr:hypothetical protein MGAD_52080 [Mycolicibacterium gadium]